MIRVLVYFASFVVRFPLYGLLRSDLFSVRARAIFCFVFVCVCVAFFFCSLSLVLLVKLWVAHE